MSEEKGALPNHRARILRDKIREYENWENLENRTNAQI